MFTKITLGQYYPADSFVHRLDPRTKLAVTLLYIVSLFVANGFVGYALGAAWMAAAVILSTVPLGYMFRGLRGILFLLLISVAFNMFLTPGEVILSFWVLQITREGLLQALRMAIRLTLLVMGSSLLTYTTTPTALTDGMEQGLGFLKVFRFPVHEIAMMMSIALRFIPILMEEADKIRKAQMARGADFESGGLISRAKALIPLLVPLFVSAFRRASDLALAMEARCYHGGDGRTRMKPLKYQRADYLVYAAAFLLLIAMIFSRRFV